MRRLIAAASAALALSALLGACTLDPHYQRPARRCP